MERVVRTLAIVVVLSGAMGGSARLARARPVGARELQARQDFAAGRYDQAREIFAALYAQTADPIFLRNIARCYQKENRAAEAIASFKEYLARAKKISAGEKDEIEGYIRELSRDPARNPAQEPPTRAPAATRPAAPEPPEAPPPTVSRAPAPAASAATPVAATPPAARPSEPRPTAPPPPPAARARAASAPVAREPPPRADVVTTDRAGGSSTVSIPGVVLTIAGAAAIGTGVAFGVAARSAARSVAGTYDQDLEKAGRRDATLQWVGYGVGAAALGAGIIFLVRGPTEPEASHLRVGLLPGGALLTGTF